VLAAHLIRGDLQAQPGSPSRGRAATVVDPDLARSLRVASARWAAARTAPTMTEQSQYWPPTRCCCRTHAATRRAPPSGLRERENARVLARSPQAPERALAECGRERASVGAIPLPRSGSSGPAGPRDRLRPTGVVTSAATGRAPCHGCDSRADRVAVTVGDPRIVGSPQPALADRRWRARGVAPPRRTTDENQRWPGGRLTDR
jgi:hypothetical protein